jgi:hypothetical protein
MLNWQRVEMNAMPPGVKRQVEALEDAARELRHDLADRARFLVQHTEIAAGLPGAVDELGVVVVCAEGVAFDEHELGEVLLRQRRQCRQQKQGQEPSENC